MRALGIDFGLRRIGLALSDGSGTLARPWRTLERHGSTHASVEQVAGLIAGLAAEADGLALVVVGLPRRLDGTPTDLTEPASRFASALADRSGLPVVRQDERLSSYEAEARLAATEPDWRRRKRSLDAAAAAVILQDYLDQARRRVPEPD